MINELDVPALLAVALAGNVPLNASSPSARPNCRTLAALLQAPFYLVLLG